MSFFLSNKSHDPYSRASAVSTPCVHLPYAWPFGTPALPAYSRLATTTHDVHGPRSSDITAQPLLRSSSLSCRCLANRRLHASHAEPRPPLRLNTKISLDRCLLIAETIRRRLESLVLSLPISRVPTLRLLSPALLSGAKPLIITIPRNP